MSDFISLPVLAEQMPLFANSLFVFSAITSALIDPEFQAHTLKCWLVREKQRKQRL